MLICKWTPDFLVSVSAGLSPSDVYTVRGPEPSPFTCYRLATQTKKGVLPSDSTRGKEFCERQEVSTLPRSCSPYSLVLADLQYILLIGGGVVNLNRETACLDIPSLLLLRAWNGLLSRIGVSLLGIVRLMSCDDVGYLSGSAWRE